MKPTLALSMHAGSCNGYLALDESSGHALLVDAPSGAHSLLEEAAERKAKVTAIALTHTHLDHVVTLGSLVQATGAPVAVHPGHGTARPGAGIRLLADGDLVEVGGLRFRVLHIPGHSVDSIALYEPTWNVLFTGDTLQAYALGGSARDPILLRSLDRLAGLPEETHVFPGHGQPTTIGNEAGWIRSMVEELQPYGPR